MTCRLIVLLILIIKIKCDEVIVSSPQIMYSPCMGSPLTSTYEYGSHPAGEENQYLVSIIMAFRPGKQLLVSFRSAAHVELDPEVANTAEISRSQEENTFIVTFRDYTDKLKFKVKGPINGQVPYFSRVSYHKTELCKFPMVGALDNLVKDSRIARLLSSSLPVGSCGKRNRKFMELILEGNSVKKGDWPWHAAIYRLEGTSNDYICGGTLISSFFVLTAAHCATMRDVEAVPDLYTVILGKHYFTGGDISSQERKVFSIKVHEDYGKPQRLDNDIALLKLMSKAIYDTYVQPACVWSSNEHNELLRSDIMGTIAGWGITNTSDNTMSPELKQVTLPMVSKFTCYEANVQLYGQLLNNGRKFCAGFRNGSLPCNGDSGGGFMVYVPDTSNGVARNSGSWHIRGIVSMTIPHHDTLVCDSNQYAIFTDISKYEDWIWANTIVKETCSLSEN